MKIGDIVRVIKGLDKDGPEWNGYFNPCEEFEGTKRIVGGGGRSRHLDDGYIYPIAVLEVTKKANGSVPGNGTKITMGGCDKPTKRTDTTRVVLDEYETLTGDSKMSTQEQSIFAVVVSENEPVKDADTGLIIKTKKRVVYSKGDLSAYGLNNATIKAVLAAGRVKGVNAIKDEDEVEVLVRPFRSE